MDIPIVVFPFCSLMKPITFSDVRFGDAASEDTYTVLDESDREPAKLLGTSLSAPGFGVVGIPEAGAFAGGFGLLPWISEMFRYWLLTVHSGESGRVVRMNPATETGAKRPLKTAKTGRGFWVKAAGRSEDERGGAEGADGSGLGSGRSACA